MSESRIRQAEEGWAKKAKTKEGSAQNRQNQ
jgi:hypothetical protein